MSSRTVGQVPILMERKFATVEKGVDPGAYVLSMINAMSLNL